MARHTLFTQLNAAKKPEMRESHGSLFHVGIFSSSFRHDTSAIFADKILWIFFFLLLLRIQLSSGTEENPRLMLVALYCMVKFLTIVKDLSTEKEFKAGRWAMLKQSLHEYSITPVLLVTCQD